MNADGDGVADRFNTYVPSGEDVRAYLQLVLDERAAISIDLPVAALTVAPIGGYDVDGDGRDELFAVTGNGAYTTWIDVFTFDPASCKLVRLAEPGGMVPQFAVGASVGNGAGLECGNGAFVSTGFSRITDEPLTYRATLATYVIEGTRLASATETTVEFGVDEASEMASFRCGELELP